MQYLIYIFGVAKMAPHACNVIATPYIFFVYVYIIQKYSMVKRTPAFSLQNLLMVYLWSGAIIHCYIYVA